MREKRGRLRVEVRVERERRMEVEARREGEMKGASIDYI